MIEGKFARMRLRVLVIDDELRDDSVSARHSDADARRERRTGQRPYVSYLRALQEWDARFPPFRPRHARCRAATGNCTCKF